VIDVDYYRLFRPTYESSFMAHAKAEWMGLIDPMTFVLRVNPDIDALIRGEQQTILASNWSSEKKVAVAVFTHEMMHWWQLVGTTIGLLHAACINVQSNILTSLLRDWVQHYEPRKSAFLAFRDAMVRRANPEMQLLYNVVGRWMDLEFWSALMDQRSAAYRVVDKPFFDSSGKTLIRAAFYSLHQLLSLGGNAMQRAEWFNQWLDEAERLAQGPNEDFTGVGILRGLRIGGREILEGQARLTEIQYLHHLSAGQLRFQQLEDMGYLDKVYGHALREFVRLAGVPWPTHPLHPSVGLCLLACDFALTSPLPYPAPLTDLSSIVRDCHPGVRFVEICRTIARNPDGWIKRFEYTREVHSEFTAALEPSPQKLSTAEVANRCVAFWEQLPDLRPIIDGAIDAALQPPATSLKFLLRKHVAFMRDKRTSPHLFCWYGALFTEVMLLKQGFIRHGPPLLSVGTSGQIFGTPALDEGTSRDPEAILYNFLITQGMNDIVRQWISGSGPFIFKYDWIDPRQPEVFWRTALGDYFAEMYGIPIDSIKILPVPN